MRWQALSSYHLIQEHQRYKRSEATDYKNKWQRRIERHQQKGEQPEVADDPFAGTMLGTAVTSRQITIRVSPKWPAPN
jgi:hypothetical protein